MTMRFSNAFTLPKTALCAGFVLLALSTSPTFAGIKCWHNKDGVRECGNTVPPEYAQAEHEVKNEHGMTIKKSSRARSLDEIHREREAKQLAERQKAEQEALAKKQAAADKVLLDTFSSEDDLVLARDGQLANIDSQIKVTESHIAKVQKSLDDLISKAAESERRNQKIPKKLTKDIDNLRTQIDDHRKFIEAKDLEKVELNKKFGADIDRFRQLRSAQR